MDLEKLKLAIKEVGREVGLRKACYPKWIASGRLTQEKADIQLSGIEAAYEILKSLENKGEING